MEQDIRYKKFPLYMRVCPWARLDRKGAETSIFAVPCRGFVIDPDTGSSTDCGVVFKQQETIQNGHGSITIEPLNAKDSACQHYEMGLGLLIDALTWTP